jgi:predicted metal-binding protein
MIARAVGFEAVAPLNIDTLELRPEVREMCAANTCGKYGKCWSCPPGCGTLDECRERIAKHSFGILVQTIGAIEDSFDVEAIMEAQAIHNRRMWALRDKIAPLSPNILAMGA